MFSYPETGAVVQESTKILVESLNMLSTCMMRCQKCIEKSTGILRDAMTLQNQPDVQEKPIITLYL